MSEDNDKDLKIPDKISKYLVMTLNRRGPVTTYIDENAQQFIDYAAKQTAPVLELGAAYGFVTIAALKEGATVIANDIEPRHLQILYNQTPEAYRSRLTLLPGAFPLALNLAKESIAGCYVARMLGYVHPTELQLGFERVFSCLKSNAKFFVIATPPYKSFYKNIIPVYEQRIRENNPWPGYFTDLKELVNQKYRAYAPEKLHFLDDKVLTRELERVGFIIEKVELFARQDLPKWTLFDGREGVVAIARKP